MPDIYRTGDQIPTRTYVHEWAWRCRECWANERAFVTQDKAARASVKHRCDPRLFEVTYPAIDLSPSPSPSGA